MRLPGLVGELIEPIADQRESQHRKLLGYQNTALTDMQADAAVVQMFRQDVISVTKIADVLAEYDIPSHDWGDKTLWRLFNAATFVLTGRVLENPQTTTRLHTILDGIAETVQ